MNNGLLRKAARESLAITIVIAIGLCGIEVLFARIFPAFYEGLSDSILQLPFVRKMIAAGLGIEAATELGPAAMMAVVWIHPVVLALVWTHAIWAGTRVPVSEIDRGTIDVLIALPVSRTSVFVAEAMVAMISGALIIGLGLLGNVIGGWSVDPEIMGTFGQRLWVSLNLWALYLSVFGMSALASSVCDRRGRAVGAVVAAVFAAFVVGFLSVYSPALKSLLFLSVLNYYRPLFVLQGGIVPVRDILVLLAAGLISWIAAAVLFARRDIRTV
jgi:ABC-2 type transport system permease protein